MWRDGASQRAIAEALGTTENTVGTEFWRMRAAGWDLPHRPWRGAMCPPHKPLPPADEILAALRGFYEQTGRAPTRREWEKQGSVTYHAAVARFGRWSKALKAAGLTPNPTGSPAKDDETRRVIERLAGGERITDIARELGISRKNLRRRIDAYLQRVT